MTDPGENRGRSGSGRDGADYGWLYGGGSKEDPPPRAQDPWGAPESGPADDPEPTRVMPTARRTGSAGATAGAGDGPGRGTSAQRPGGPPPRRPVRRPRRGRFARVVLAVLVLWVVFLVAVPIWAWTQVSKVDADPGGDRPADQPGTNYLLVGSDSREGLTKKQRRRLATGKAEGRRTDTILLLHTGSGPSLLMSIPRDSQVEVPGHGTTKINAAYAYGGPKLLVRTVESDTGIRVDNYVEIGFAGFVDVVDAVGGVRICPDQAIKDPLANLDINKGCQEADGREALGYARSRHTLALGDIDRARHQREVVSAVGSKAASPWSVLNPLRYFGLNKAGAEAVRVGEDTGPVDTLRFAWAMTRVNGENGLTCSVPISDLAVTWDPDRAPAMFKRIRNDRTEDISKDLCSPSGLRGR